MTAPGSATPRCSEPSASGPGRGWFQNETRGNLLATPAPARDPRGPRFLYTSRAPAGIQVCSTRGQIGILEEKERGRQGAGCRAQAVAGLLAAWPGRRVSPRCPLRPGSGRAVWPPTLVGAAGFPRGGFAHIPPATFRPELPLPVQPAPSRCDDSSRAPGPLARSWPGPGGRLTRATALLPPDALSPGTQVAGVCKVPSTDP